MDGSPAHQPSATARVRQQAISTINSLFGDEGTQVHQEGLESLIAQVPTQTRYHEERIQQHIDEIKADLGGIYDLMKDLENNLIGMSETQDLDTFPGQDTEMIDSIGQIWKIRSSVEIVKQGLESSLELESFAEELHSCQEALQATQLRQVLHQRSQILGLASSLPHSNHLRLTATSIWDFIGTRLEEVFEPLLKEEVNIYNPSTFSKEQVSTNMTGLSNSLADYFVVAFEANCTDKFLEAYNAKKLQILQKRMFGSKPGDSREYLTALSRLAQVLVRESTLLSNSADNIQTLNLGENCVPMVAAFEKHVTRPYMVELFKIFSGVLEFPNADLIAKVTEELKREAYQVSWRESWQLIVESFLHQQALACLTEVEAKDAKAALVKPLESISRRTLAEVSDTFESVSADKTKPTELDDKLQSIHFDQYAVALRYSLRLQCEQGFGLQLAAWVQQASNFARSAAHKLQDCLRVYERYYFGLESAAEVQFDPYLLLDRNRYKRTILDAQAIQEVIKDLPILSSPFGAFSVPKKLMNSLLQIMINIFAEFLLFKSTIAEVFGDLASESPQHIQKRSLLTHDAKQVLGLKSHCDADRVAAQSAISILTHQFSTIESDFKRDLLCLMVKDSRDSLARFFGQPGSVSSLQGELERQAAGLASKLTQICEDHSQQQQESYLAARVRDWEGCVPDRPGVPQSAPAVEQLSAPSARAGAVYWLELYFTGLVCFCLLQVRTLPSLELAGVQAKALEAVKPAIGKWVKYRVTNNSSS